MDDAHTICEGKVAELGGVGGAEGAGRDGGEEDVVVVAEEEGGLGGGKGGG